MKASLISLMVLVSSAAQALPGFVGRLQPLHPELKVTCLTCHQVKPPSPSNVTEKGRRFYEEVMASDRKHEPAGRPLLTGAPDFIVYGDSRDNANVHRALVQEFCRQKAKAVFHTGDLVGDGSSNAQWAAALRDLDCLIKTKSLYPSCGNHEGAFCTNNVVRRALGNTAPFYTVKRGELTFIALDSNQKTAAQQKWLASLPVGPSYVPFFHHPPYPTMAGHAPDQDVIRDFLPQFRRLGVKLVFNGHNHGYDRAIVDGVQFVTEGGGGAPLYPCGPEKPYTQVCLSDFGYVRCAIAGQVVSCEARRQKDGAVVDSFTVDYSR